MNDPDWLPPARPPGEMMNESYGGSLPLSLKVFRPIGFAYWQLMFVLLRQEICYKRPSSFPLAQSPPFKISRHFLLADFLFSDTESALEKGKGEPGFTPSR